MPFFQFHSKTHGLFKCNMRLSPVVHKCNLTMPLMASKWWHTTLRRGVPRPKSHTQCSLILRSSLSEGHLHDFISFYYSKSENHREELSDFSNIIIMALHRLMCVLGWDVFCHLPTTENSYLGLILFQTVYHGTIASRRSLLSRALRFIHPFIISIIRRYETEK